MVGRELSISVITTNSYKPHDFVSSSPRRPAMPMHQMKDRLGQFEKMELRLPRYGPSQANSITKPQLTLGPYFTIAPMPMAH